MIIKIHGIEETNLFGEKLGALLQAGDVVCLNGDLGAGKTTLSKAIGMGLEVEEHITSPTFTLINEYSGRLNLYHFDVYRINNSVELFDLGADDYFYGKGVCLIEWAENIEEALPKDRLELWIFRGESNNDRNIEIKTYGSRYEMLLRELLR